MIIHWLYLSIKPVHTKGINWGQALAVWVPIVGGLVGIVLALIAGVHSFKKWREERENQNLLALKGIVDSFGQTLNVKFDQINTHLSRQDERINRIDRNTGTDST